MPAIQMQRAGGPEVLRAVELPTPDLAARAHTHVGPGPTTGKVVLRVPQDHPSEAAR
jgi:NADPH:quinone reductase-like Zn-dependent oxidoreductase